MMKTIFLSVTFLCSILMTLKSQTLKTEDDSLAYSLGVLVAQNLKQQGFADINVDVYLQGFKAALNDEPTLIPVEMCDTHVRDMSSKKKMKMHEVNKNAGEAFLAENKKRPEITTLASGLQYEILQAGDGPKPNATDKVLVHYHGTLVDGTIFDSSVERGEPISFGLNQVIKGWTEVVQLMPVGSKWRTYIPYQLAYGDRGAGPKIQPYSALVFEIELLAIE
jgi:FKBP-type peptidyl-prolyl cis-trans isomerase FklB